MKHIIVITTIIALIAAQIYLIGINGLTLVSIPVTIYLGLEVIEKITDKNE